MRSQELNTADRTVASHIVSIAVGEGTPNEKFRRIIIDVNEVVQVGGMTVDGQTTLAARVFELINKRFGLMGQTEDVMVPELERLARAGHFIATGEYLPERADIPC